MDLHLTDSKPTDAEKSVIDGALKSLSTPESGGNLRLTSTAGRVGVGGTALVRKSRHKLLPVLQEVQDQIGWISSAAMGYICRLLRVPPADAYGVASFYALLSTEERPPRVVHVCDDIVCRRAGSAEICHELEQQLGLSGQPVHSSATWMTSPCLGLCDQTPAVLLQLAGETDRVLPAASPVQIMKELKAPPASQKLNECSLSSYKTVQPVIGARLSLLARVGRIDPENIGDYCQHGGFSALRKAIKIGPKGVLRELHDSKLLGRGGAAFPTATKWDSVAQSTSYPNYVVCNADESEPGTFKDRVIMEQDPFAVIESMGIAGLTIGATTGFIYVRGEYPLATQRLRNAITKARDNGFLGANILGTEMSFDIDLRRGAGAYICGEETAMLNSIEGYRGEPRSKPPYPTEAGLFGQPTVINNIETMVNVLPIILSGGQAYAERGTSLSTGTKLFCLSGDIAVPGLYEVDFGISLGQLIDLAGGIKGSKIRAVLLGGAAGSFVGPDHLNMPLTFEGTSERNVTLGSGAIIPFAEGTDFFDVVQRIARFFRDESCGQCVPCRVGTVRQEEALARIKEQPHFERDILSDLAMVMTDASICGLGHTAAKALQSAMKLGLLNNEGR